MIEECLFLFRTRRPISFMIVEIVLRSRLIPWSSESFSAACVGVKSKYLSRKRSSIFFLSSLETLLCAARPRERWTISKEPPFDPFFFKRKIVLKLTPKRSAASRADILPTTTDSMVPRYLTSFSLKQMVDLDISGHPTKKERWGGYDIIVSRNL